MNHIDENAVSATRATNSVVENKEARKAELTVLLVTLYILCKETRFWALPMGGEDVKTTSGVHDQTIQYT